MARKIPSNFRRNFCIGIISALECQGTGRLRNVVIGDVFVEDFLAFGNDGHRVFAGVTEIEQQGQGAAEGLPVLNVERGMLVRAKRIRKFRLSRVQFIAHKGQMVAGKGTEFADIGVIFRASHDK